VEDDKVDACSGALEMLNPRTKSWGMFESHPAEGRAATRRATSQTATRPIPIGPWLHGMARREHPDVGELAGAISQRSLRAGALPFGPVGVVGATTELTQVGGPRVRILLPPAESLRTLGPSAQQT
jgi:hypothetical protein